MGRLKKWIVTFKYNCKECGAPMERIFHTDGMNDLKSVLTTLIVYVQDEFPSSEIVELHIKFDGWIIT